MENEKRRKILLVDDINYSLLSLKERLKKQYEVYTALTAETMFEILENVTPEIIILDINMPEVDGFQVLTKLKEDLRYFEIPVIFLSGKKDRKSIIKGMKLGAADYLTKPASDKDVIESIEQQLDDSKQTSKKASILAIDDDPAILRSINAILSDLYVVRTVSDPLVVKELIKSTTPDLFLIDCQMPGLHGFELVPIIRKNSLLDETPIVFLTSEGTIDNISVAMSLGAADYIVKPINEKILRDKMAQDLSDFVIRRRLRGL